MFKWFCRLGWHCWHTAPNGMIRLCTNCHQWETNRNSSCDPVSCWRAVDNEEAKLQQEMWHKKGQVL